MKINLNNEYEAGMNIEREEEAVTDRMRDRNEIENLTVENIQILNQIRKLEKKLDKARALLFDDDSGDIDFIKFKWQREIDPS